MDKVKFESNKINTQTGEPLFNSGLAYLERLDNINRNFHQAMYMDAFEVAYSILAGLQAEVTPRLNPDEIKNLRILRHKSGMFVQTTHTVNGLNKKSNITAFNIRNVLIEWFEQLNILMHQKGLVMPNKDDMTNALKV